MSWIPSSYLFPVTCSGGLLHDLSCWSQLHCRCRKYWWSYVRFVCMMIDGVRSELWGIWWCDLVHWTRPVLHIWKWWKLWFFVDYTSYRWTDISIYTERIELRISPWAITATASAVAVVFSCIYRLAKNLVGQNCLICDIKSSSLWI